MYQNQSVNMNNIIIFVTFAIFIPCCLTNCLIDDEDIKEKSESCYKTIKPILDYFAIVHKQELSEAFHYNTVVERLDKIESQIRSQANVTLDNQMTLLNRVETQLDCEKIAQSLKQQLEESLAKVGNLESQLASKLEAINLAESSRKESERRLEDQLSLAEHELKEQLNLVEKYKAERLKNFQKIDSKYYFIEQNESLSWEAASNRCKQMGSHLINIQNGTEYNAVNKELTPELLYWTGINDRNTEGTYVTETGDTANFLLWRQLPDNDNNEDCIEFSPDIGMNDNDCSFEYYFICEISAELE